MLERVGRHVLRFVDDQDRAPSLAVFTDEEVEEILEHLDLFLASMLQLECEQDPLHQLAERPVGVRDEADGGVAVHLPQHVADQRRLAGADVPGDDVEAGLVHQPVFQQGQGRVVFGAEIEKTGIGENRERFFAEAVEGFVHVGCRSGGLLRSRGSGLSELPGFTGLVQHRADQLAAAQKLRRALDVIAPRLAVLDDQQHRVDVRREGQHVGGAQQRRQIEDDDAGSVVVLEFSDERGHLLPSEHFGGILLRPAARKHDESPDAGIDQEVFDGRVGEEVVAQARTRIPSKIPADAGLPQIRVDQQRGLVVFHRQADGQVDRGERLAFARPRTGDAERVPAMLLQPLRYLRGEYLERVREPARIEAADDSLFLHRFARHVDRPRPRVGEGAGRLLGGSDDERPGFRQSAESGFGNALLPRPLDSFRYAFHVPPAISRRGSDTLAATGA